MAVVPDWIAALGTVGAFGIALIIYWREVKDRRRSQAASVSAWWTRVDQEGRDIGWHRDTELGEEAGFHLWAKNSSADAVYDCLLFVDAELAAGVEAGEVVRLGPYAQFHNGQVLFGLGTLPPGESIRYFVDRQRVASLGKVTVLLRDTDGRVWRREEGRLEQLRAKRTVRAGSGPGQGRAGRQA